MRSKEPAMSPIGRCLAVAIACAALSLPGCLVEDLTAPPPSPVDSTLILRMREELSPGARRLFLEVRTRTIYPCFNYRIDHLAGIEGRTIWIQFTGVSIGPICLTALGPARATIPLGTLAEVSYDLVLTVRRQARVSELLVAAEAFTVRPARTAWTEFEDPVLRRVPPGTIWGAVCYDAARKEPLVERYLDELRALGARSEPFVPGDYGHFRVDASGNIEPPDSHGCYFNRPYLFRFDGDTSTFPDIVRGYADSAYVSLYNDRGESWLSWVLANRAAAMPAARRPKGG